ncbi:MAG: hypothetical protein NDI61_03400 [Bdellovibrionaceae bacterium]|nr:hypothetical protein [Pseudobdellovibrionaceae bacterium]
MLKDYWKLLSVGGLVSYFLACSPVQFNKIPAPPCHGSGLMCVQTCNESGCVEKFENVKTVGAGAVDILFVNDNSGSMSYEQNHMGAKFPNFIQSLGHLDYRIAITTTDVSGATNAVGVPRASSRQDGALLDFGSGLKFIDRNTSNAVGLFDSTIRRQETLECEQSGYQTASCPSGDERGIYAANLAIDRNDGGFLRPTAPLAIVILADEDVRSGMYPGGSRQAGTTGYNSSPLFPLNDYDLPETLVSRFKAKFPTKSLSVHSIVIKNNDSSCLSTQSGQGGNVNVVGSYGRLYEQLSTQAGGVIGSICSSDYGQELGQIAYEIQNQVTSMSFVCRPIDDKYHVEFFPKPSYDVIATPDFERLVVEFDRALPPETKIQLSYSCEKMQN